MLYPIRFRPIYKEMIWGGKKFEQMLYRTPPSEHTGESWDISCRPRSGEVGIIDNGSLAGVSFVDYINMDRKAVLGSKLYECADFPLLVKIIDANDDLSVQVHPNDAEAAVMENYPYGKNEMWYIMDAPKDGCLVIGVRDGVNRDNFAERLAFGDISVLNRLPVKRGDVVNIPSGLIHAITKGMLLAEIQQNSDITYRVFDYNRPGLDGKPRPLHLDKALRVADFSGKATDIVEGLPVYKDDNCFRYYIANEYFAVIKYEVSQTLSQASDPSCFHIFTCVGGSCAISCGNEDVEIKEGDSVFIPAAMGVYKISGCCELLQSYVPDIEKDFIEPLMTAGYSLDEIMRHTACSLNKPLQ